MLSNVEHGINMNIKYFSADHNLTFEKMAFYNKNKPTNKILFLFLYFSSKQKIIVNSVDLEEQKRLEYEKWFKTQEKEQQELEYDCSVKYEATTTNTQQGMIY